MAMIIDIGNESWSFMNHYMRLLVQRIRVVAPDLSEGALRAIDQAASFSYLSLDTLREEEPAEAHHVAAAVSTAARSLVGELADSSDDRDRAVSEYFDGIAIAAAKFIEQPPVEK